MSEILETIRMVQTENLDIRTITMGISLRDCCHPDINVVCDKIYDKIMKYSCNLIETAEGLEKEYGIPIINKRISVTPISIIAESCDAEDYVKIALTMDKAAEDVGVDFIGGFSAMVHKGFTRGDISLLSSIPNALASTKRVCSSVNVATSKAGINMDAVLSMGKTIKKTAELTADSDGIGCAKLVVFANVPEDNPLWLGLSME